MPYYRKKRKYTRRKKSYRKKSYGRKRRRKSNGSVSKLWTAIKRLRYQTRPEMKYLLKAGFVPGTADNKGTFGADVTCNSVGQCNITGSGLPDWNGAYSPIEAGVLQGVGGGDSAAGSVLGNKFLIKTFSIRYQWAQPLLAPDRSNKCTILLIADTCPEMLGVLNPPPVLSDIYKDVSSAITDGNFKLAFNNQKSSGKKKRFHVMKKRTHTIGSGPGVPLSESYGMITLRNLRMDWNQASRCFEGFKLWFFVFSDSQIAPHPLFTWNSQTMFTDV